MLLFTFVFVDFLDVLVEDEALWAGLGGRNDARKSNDILILTNKILIVCGPRSPLIITLFTAAPPHSYTANDSDFKPQ